MSPPFPSLHSVRWFFLAVSFFCLTTALTALGALGPVDRLSTHLRLHVSPDLAAWFAAPFTIAGSVEVTTALVVCIAALHWRRNRWSAVALVLAFLAVNLIEIGLKAVLSHPNPPVLRHHVGPALPESRLLALLSSGSLPLLPAVLLNSYPSGHMARTLLLCLLLCARFPARLLRAGVAIFAVLLAGALVLAGAHWPSDVLGGAFLGCAAACAAASLASYPGKRQLLPAPHCPLPTAYCLLPREVNHARSLRTDRPHRHRHDQPSRGAERDRPSDERRAGPRLGRRP